MKITLTFADGRRLGGLSLNGNCFISAIKPDESYFTRASLSYVKVSIDGLSASDSDAALIYTELGRNEFKNAIVAGPSPAACLEMRDAWYFTLREQTEREILEESTQLVITEMYETALTTTASTDATQLALVELYERILKLEAK